MTKIKNTKKGMAKKTLSMSLVVAMLATSNVPVWAAEFSDGSDASVAAETPAVETTDEFSDDAAQSRSDGEGYYTSTISVESTSINTGSALSYTGEFKATGLGSSVQSEPAWYYCTADGKEVLVSEGSDGNYFANEEGTLMVHLIQKSL